MYRRKRKKQRVRFKVKRDNMGCLYGAIGVARFGNAEINEKTNSLTLRCRFLVDRRISRLSDGWALEWMASSSVRLRSRLGIPAQPQSTTEMHTLRYWREHLNAWLPPLFWKGLALPMHDLITVCRHWLPFRGTERNRSEAGKKAPLSQAQKNRTFVCVCLKIHSSTAADRIHGLPIGV